MSNISDLRKNKVTRYLKVYYSDTGRGTTDPDPETPGLTSGDPDTKEASSSPDTSRSLDGLLDVVGESDKPVAHRV